MRTISYSKEIRGKVTDAFAEKRRASREEAEKRKNEVYLCAPEVMEIDRELSKTGLKIYGEAMRGDRATLDKRIEVLQKENEELLRARASLMESAGFPSDYMTERHECEKCSDTGYVGIDPCECLIKAFRKQAYLSSGLGKLLTNQDFSNFDIKIYPEASRRMMSFIYKKAKEFAENFSESEPQNIMFYGKTGLGKTHLSTAIAKRVIDRGFTVIYDSAMNIMHTFERERFSREEVAHTTDKYFDCDLLIIDDLGAEFMSSFTHATLLNILNTRIYAGKSTLISTNLDDTEALKKTYDDRVVSRLVGEFRQYRFEGNDIRLGKGKN